MLRVCVLMFLIMFVPCSCCVACVCLLLLLIYVCFFVFVLCLLVYVPVFVCLCFVCAFVPLRFVHVFCAGALPFGHTSRRTEAVTRAESYLQTKYVFDTEIRIGNTRF